MALSNLKKIAPAAIALSTLAAGPAHAEIVEDVQIGVLAHNVQVLTAKTAGREDGPTIEAQINFDDLDFLGALGEPMPFLVGSLNAAGDTSFAGGGLKWSLRFADAWAFEPELGYVIHNGEVSNPFPNGDPRATAFSEDNLLFGSRDLFRVAFGLSRDLSDKTYATLFYNHLSHGQILGEGRNQGVDQLGVRLGYRFDD